MQNGRQLHGGAYVSVAWSGIRLVKEIGGLPGIAGSARRDAFVFVPSAIPGLSAGAAKAGGVLSFQAARPSYFDSVCRKNCHYSRFALSAVKCLRRSSKNAQHCYAWCHIEDAEIYRACGFTSCSTWLPYRDFVFCARKR